MDVSPDGLYTRLGTSKAPLLIDVRRREAFDADNTLIIGAARRLPMTFRSGGRLCPEASP